MARKLSAANDKGIINQELWRQALMGQGFSSTDGSVGRNTYRPFSSVTRADKRNLNRLSRSGVWRNPQALATIPGGARPAGAMGPAAQIATKALPPAGGTGALGGAANPFAMPAGPQHVGKISYQRALPPASVSRMAAGQAAAAQAAQGTMSAAAAGVPGAAATPMGGMAGQAAAQAAPTATAAARSAAPAAARAASVAPAAAGGAGRAAGLLGGASRGALLRGAGFGALGGQAAKMALDAVWDDESTYADEAAGGALAGAGIGAGIGSVVPGLGTLAGGLAGGAIGGAIGYFGPKSTGEKAVASAYEAQSKDFNALLDKYGVDDLTRQNLMQQIDFSLMNANSKDEVKQVFQQATGLVPAALAEQQMENEAMAQSAALQAAIMPLLQEQQRGYVDSVQNAVTHQMSAANQIPDAEIANILRAQAQQQIADAYGYNQAALSQMATAPILADTLNQAALAGGGTQYTQANGAPAMDLSSLLANQVNQLNQGL